MWAAIGLTILFFLSIAIADKKIEDNDKFEKVLFVLWVLYIVSILVYIVIIGRLYL